MPNIKPQVELAKILAKELPRIRQAFGLSQTRLGMILGKSRQQISKIERGLAPLSWDTCLAIILVVRNKDENLFVSVVGEDFINDLCAITK